ncbi:MAG TPA: HAD hydrolase-like protein [Gemmatimonadales bacterium]
MRKLILFDIDGTILLTRGAGRRAIHAAMLQEMGVEDAIAHIRFDGKTDPQIVRELLDAAGSPNRTDDRVAAICDRYVAILADELVGQDDPPKVFPGVVELLARIEGRDDAVLGLVTGNLAGGARLKLESAGIAFARFRVGAFGSDHADRSELPAIAAERAAPIMGRIPHGAEIVIIGDTPADMTCGRAVGARALGVATGAYTADELRSAGGYAAFDDLSDAEALLETIYD